MQKKYGHLSKKLLTAPLTVTELYNKYGNCVFTFIQISSDIVFSRFLCSLVITHLFAVNPDERC
jgi:hypothetical protein